MAIKDSTMSVRKYANVLKVDEKTVQTTTKKINARP